MFFQKYVAIQYKKNLIMKVGFQPVILFLLHEVVIKLLCMVRRLPCVLSFVFCF